MPFPREERKGIPTSIGQVTVMLIDVDGDVAKASAQVTVAVLDEGGRIVRTHGPISILSEMTAAQRSAAWNFLQAIRTKATNEVLPPPA